MIRIWEVKAQKNVASFADHAVPVRSLAFSGETTFFSKHGTHKKRFAFFK